MLLLGWAIGPGSTRVDDFFLHDVRRVVGAHPGVLLVFTDWRFLTGVLAGGAAIALYRRRWRLAAIVALCPPMAIGLVEVAKRFFDRHKEGALAYPSGHATAVIVVLGLLVLIAGARWWVVMVAVAVSALGMLGEVLCGYHYLTDVLGAALLSTALLCLAAALVGAPPPTGPPPHATGTTQTCPADDAASDTAAAGDTPHRFSCPHAGTESGPDRRS